MERSDIDHRGVLGEHVDLTLPALVRDLAERTPDRVVVRSLDGQARTAKELWRNVRSVAGGLADLGVRPGDRVATLLDNSVELIELFFGVIYAGAVFVPMNTAWRGPSLRSILEDSEPSAVVVPAARAAEVAELVERSCVLMLSGDPGTERGDAVLADVMRKALGVDVPWYDPAPRDLAMLLYTSGTTGASKGNMLTHRSCLWMAATASSTLSYTEEDVVHSCLPLFHANALLCGLLGALLSGATFVLSPRFTASRYWEEVASCGATQTALLGSMIPLLLAQPERPAEHEHQIRVAYCAPLPERVSVFERRFGLKCAATYGLTDANILTVREPDDSDVQSCGVASPDWELQVVDDDGRELPRGQAGELRARPRQPFIASLGYWRRPAATVELWRDLWVNTGDILYQDEQGRFHFVDRKKDAIRKGGENISSAEVEEVIGSHPAIGEAAVFAVPSDLAEDEVMAVLVVKDGADVSYDEVFQYCARELPYFAVPRYLELAEELPRTENHRVRKAELRKAGVTRRTWDAGPVTRRRVDDLAGR